MTKSNLAIGQTVWVKCIGDAVRYRDKNDLIVKAIVEKVGNKYFYLSDFYSRKFDIAKMREATNFEPDYQVYLSLQEIKDEEEIEEKIKAIREFFKQYGKVDITLEKLRQVYDIVIGGSDDQE
jgi:hypothetical protein